MLVCIITHAQQELAMPTNLALALFGLAYVAVIGGGIWYLVDLTKTGVL